MKPNELYKKYGKDLQINMVIEEMSELTNELLKDKRGKDNRENIVEEYSDVFLYKDSDVELILDKEFINQFK